MKLCAKLSLTTEQPGRTRPFGVAPSARRREPPKQSAEARSGCDIAWKNGYAPPPDPVQVVVVETDRAVGDTGEIVRSDVEPGGGDVLADRARPGDVVVKRERSVIAREDAFEAVNLPLRVVERGQDDRCTNWPSSINSFARLS